MVDKIAVFDLDGVLAEYHGFGNGDIGKPLELGIKLAERMHDAGFKVIVQTCRTSYGSVENRGKQTVKVQSWIRTYLPIAELYLGYGKAHGHVYFDDRAVPVHSNWKGTHTNQSEYAWAMMIAEEALKQS